MNTNLVNNQSDVLASLPTDKNQPTHSELKIIDSIFKEDFKEASNEEIKNTKKSFMKVISQYILLTFIIMLFYFIPNDSIKNFLPVALSNNELATIFIKSSCVSIIFYLFQTYYLTTPN